jgi:hypothetical protein
MFPKTDEGHEDQQTTAKMGLGHIYLTQHWDIVDGQAILQLISSGNC